MKKSILLFSIILSFITVFAENFLQKTAIEDAVFTKDFLYKQEVFSVDNIPAFRIDAVKVTNLEKFSVTSGLRVIHKMLTGKEYKTHYNYIDIEEIEGLIVSLQYMRTILKSKTIPSNYTEIKYTTKSGFQIMLYTVVNTQNKLDWSFTVQTNISNDKSAVSLTVNDIEKLQKTLEQAKGKL